MENPEIIKTVLIFYLLMCNSTLNPLMSKQWVTFMENNRIVQHIIAIGVLITLMTLMNEGKMNNFTIIAYSIAIYLWFIFSTKMDIHWNIIIIIMLLFAYAYENTLKIKENEMKDDKVLSEDEKNNLLSSQSKYRLCFIGAVVVMTVVGTCLYSNKKEIQYGGGYSIYNFMIG